MSEERPLRRIELRDGLLLHRRRQVAAGIWREAHRESSKLVTDIVYVT